MAELHLIKRNFILFQWPTKMLGSRILFSQPKQQNIHSVKVFDTSQKSTMEKFPLISWWPKISNPRDMLNFSLPLLWNIVANTLLSGLGDILHFSPKIYPLFEINHRYWFWWWSVGKKLFLCCKDPVCFLLRRWNLTEKVEFPEANIFFPPSIFCEMATGSRAFHGSLGMNNAGK